ncbi:MAG: thioredoxin family protein [Phycisphaerae bacterium]
MKSCLKISLMVLGGISLLVMSGCEKKTDTEAAETLAVEAVEADAVGAPAETTTSPEVQAVIQAEQQLPKLLDLGADQCIPCKKLAPILEELAKEYRGEFDVEFIDVWKPENKEKALSYEISSIPTQIFYDADGKELYRHVGFIPKEDILNKWKELGFAFEAAESE